MYVSTKYGIGAVTLRKWIFHSLPIFAKAARRFEHILAGALAAFHPGSTAQAHADGGRVGDLERLDIAIEGSEDVARDSAEFRNRRIIRMNADANAGFLGHRGNLADEVRIVIPQFFF